MDESTILSKFDNFVESDVVLYDDQQRMVEHVDGKLKVRFLVTNALARKPTISNPGNAEAERDGSDISTTGFEMGDVGSSHVLVANKFALARPHMMVLTTDGYRRQYEPLDESDLTAAWTVLNDLSTEGGRDYVVFYNCGQDGGCSRLHKHMQLIPTPPASLASFLDVDQNPTGFETREPDVPFHQFYHRFAKDRKNVTSTDLVKMYANLLKQAAAVSRGDSEHDDTSLPDAAACPHNLVFTRRWMLVIPRRRGAVTKEIAANAIGMLGVIPVASQQEMEGWIKFGPARALIELGVPK